MAILFKEIEKTKLYQVEVATAESIIKTINLIYQNDTAEKFLSILNQSIVKELNRRMIEKMKKGVEVNEL